MSCQMAASKGWDLFHIDLKTAFLPMQSNDVNRDVCQLPPEASHPPHVIPRLEKPACGMNDASRRWWNILDKALEIFPVTCCVRYSCAVEFGPSCNGTAQETS